MRRPAWPVKPRLKATIKHYYDFGVDRPVVGDDLVNPASWDGLRTRTDGAFAIPRTREEFIRAAEGRPEIAARAQAINSWLEQHGARAVASYGVGGAQLEWCLHRLRPGRELIVTDFGEETLGRLGDVFPEAKARYHDLRQDDPLSVDVHLFHRIDTELTDGEWRDAFRRFESVPILVVATHVLDIPHLLFELAQRPLVKLRHASSAGFSRTRAAFEALWEPTHSAKALRMHDLHAWALEPGRASTGRVRPE
jgi:hypothetical protein